MKGIESRVIEIEPWRVVEYRAGEGAPVVLVHGLAGSFEWWGRNVSFLATRYGVAGIDLPGFGAARGFIDTQAALPLEEASALLGRWIANRFEGPVHVVGHSMGGQMGIELAAARPELVRSLCLISSSGLPLATLPRHLARNIVPPRGFFSFLPRLGFDLFRAGPGSIARSGAEILLSDSREAMSRIRCPVLVIWGSRDQLLPPSYGTELHLQIPQSELEIIEGAGHLPMWEAAEEVNRLLFDFLQVADDSASEETEVERRASRLWAIAGCRKGICWRGVESRPDMVLIHGLGIRSRYFRKLARELASRGLGVAAPDLPGFGESWEVDRYDVDAVAVAIVEWARSIATENALWMGHSTGTQIVRRVRELAPGLVEWPVYVSPIWADSRPSLPELAFLIARDALKEPAPLVAEATRAYWESGLLRFVTAFRAYARDLAREPDKGDGVVVAGRSDPLTDREHLEQIGLEPRLIDGGHGVVWSHPEQLARELVSIRSPADV